MTADGGAPRGVGRALPHELVTSPLPTAILAADGGWISCNPAMTVVLGQPPATFADLVDEPSLDLRAVLASPGAVTLAVRLPDGRPAEALLTSRAGSDRATDAAADPDRLVQLIDRGEVAALESRLLEAANAADSFASRVSHDLKNPIGTAQGYAELLSTDDALPAEARSFADRITSSTGRALATLLEIVEDARSVSRVAPPDEVDLDRLLTEVRTELADLLEGRGAVVVATTPLPTLRANQRVLRRALTALVRNAVEHHPGAARVEVSARPRTTGWSLSVDDDGPGIPAPDRPAALGLRGPDAGDAAASEGVGLALTRAAIARYGGELQLGDSPAGGLRASLFVPQRRARDAQVPPA